LFELTENLSELISGKFIRIGFLLILSELYLQKLKFKIKKNCVWRRSKLFIRKETCIIYNMINFKTSNKLLILLELTENLSELFSCWLDLNYTFKSWNLKKKHCASMCVVHDYIEETKTFSFYMKVHNGSILYKRIFKKTLWIWRSGAQTKCTQKSILTS